MQFAWRCLLALWCAPLAAQAAQPAPAAGFDLVLRGGTLIDGSGGDAVTGDVAIADDRIAALGEFEIPAGTPVLWLEGLTIAPGFIDLHGHADGTVVRTPHCQNFLRMGVTTLITGNCGGSVENLATHFGRIDRGGIGVNYGSLIGHGTVRNAVMGSANRAPTPAELTAMQQLVATAMRDGAFGMSTGLIYVPGSYAEADEITALASVVGRFGGIYVSHMRNEGDAMPAAIAETIAIGEHGGCRVHVSHVKCSGKANHGRAAEMLALLDAARARGVAVSADQYAYDASSTGLDVLFPTAELAIGRAEFAARLRDDPEFRKRMKQMLLRGMADAGFGDLRYARIASARGNTSLNGMLLPAAARQRLGNDGPEAQAELALTLFADAAPSRVTMVYHKMAEADVEAFMRQPWIAIASDAGVRDPNGSSRPHPRGTGNNVRVLARYVRERHVLDLPTAVHKMSEVPARAFGIRDRGVLRVGAFADLVVFDPVKVQDRATYEDPVAPPDGITHVFVNGRLAVANGELTGVRAGRVLRHQATTSEVGK
ncbi:MAG: D-aminoacylase [Planctomycetes bacterium]|nr:D-aminoacylase [Planctomycetota bacterium]